MKHWRFLVLLIMPSSVFCQHRPDIDLENFAERIFQIQDDDINYETLYESLLLYYSNPIDINKASLEELSSLYILSPKQIHSLLVYHEKYGDFISLYELQVVPTLDESTIQLLLPFVTIKSVKPTGSILQRIISEPNNYLLLRYSRGLEKQKGFKQSASNGYHGNPDRMYGRFRVSHPKDFSVGITFEKDPGEEFNSTYGFDFYSGHLMLEDKGIFQSIIVGDFQMQFGQGLVFGSGFHPGKGSETVNTIKRNTLGIRPYTSVLESGFFRGVGSTIKIGSIETTLIASNLKQDARLTQDTTYTAFDEHVNGIQATGLHRTTTEVTAKNNLSEKSVGFGMTYSLGYQFKLGITGLYSHFSSPLVKKPTNYNQNEFQGVYNWIGSCYANYNWQNFMFFGELARSRSGGIGAVGGFMASLAPKLDISMLLRSYDRDFHSFYGSSFGENSRPINEKGIYWGLKYRPMNSLTLAIYFDKFQFPWLKYRVESPSDGYEYLGRITYKINKKISLYGQFRSEQKGRTIVNENLNRLSQSTKHNVLVNIDYQLNKSFEMRTRVQGSTFNINSDHTSGFAIIQDFSTSFWRFKASIRYALFDTEDYENRQYVYERDVLYAFSIPAYNGVGSRKYILLQYKAASYAQIYLRYARFDFVNQNEIGSGLSTINGDTKSEIKIMLRLKL